ncbi:hypothetical protein [Uliginosibacterium gangwonense]|uniref:hypothetical protein n=1 Tax=Uliginosibacterium gangwonense TaxID=392736 RepID=UPI00035D0802|nr:hypothetical protein [Uliginosibacterium gangwonense]
MKSHTLTHILSLALFAISANQALAAPQDAALPFLFQVIKTAPANTEGFTRTSIIYHDGDGEGEELPPSVMYYRGKDDDWEYMAISNRRLCKRASERKVCRAFEKFFERQPHLGKEITNTRIAQTGFVSTFLVHVPSVEIPSADRSIAFIGADSQDPPASHLTLYIYARKGTDLIQLAKHFGTCVHQDQEQLSDVAYYRKYCISDKIRAEAEAAGKTLLEHFYQRQ